VKQRYTRIDTLACPEIPGRLLLFGVSLQVLRHSDQPIILCPTAASRGRTSLEVFFSSGHKRASLCRDLTDEGKAVSDGSIVLLRALLTGMGRHAECDILVRKLSRNESNVTSAAGSPAYSECSVISAPADLPDGEYRVQFEGHFVVATREHGVWHFPQPVSRTFH
jgi:hypothetical protein